MQRSKSFLAKCSKARELGLAPRFEVGEIIGREFADLGAELFEVLPGERMLSLYTGKITTLANDDRDKLFLVPDCDRLVDLIERQGVMIRTLQQSENRDWVVQLNDKFVVGPTIVEALLITYINLAESK